MIEIIIYSLYLQSLLFCVHWLAFKVHWAGFTLSWAGFTLSFVSEFLLRKYFFEVVRKHLSEIV